MKRILFRTQKVIAAAVVTVILGVTGAVAVGQSIQQDDATDAQEAARSEAHFWRVVAGAESGSPTVDVLLARDLRGLSASQVERFRGDSNRYGGITDAIGYDPFDETGLDCFECGPLDVYTKDNLALIRQGGLDQVLQDTEVPSPDQGLTLTPAGMSTMSWVALLWMVGGPLTLAAAHYTAKAIDLQYATVRRFGDVFTADEQPPKTMMLMAPSFWLPYSFYREMTERRFQDKVQDAFPLQMEAIHRFDRALEEAPVDSTTFQMLREHRNEVVREIEAQTRSGEGRDDQIETLMQQLEDVQVYLKARAEAKKELR